MEAFFFVMRQVSAGEVRSRGMHGDVGSSAPNARLFWDIYFLNFTSELVYISLQFLAFFVQILRIRLIHYLLDMSLHVLSFFMTDCALS